jgi:Glycosyl transferase family 2
MNASPQRLPPSPFRARVHNRLRRVKHRWRRVFPPRLPPWTGVDDAPPVGVPPPRTGHLEIIGETLGQVRARLQRTDLGLAVRVVDVVVAHWRAPWPGWSGRLGPVPGLRSRLIGLPAGGAGTATVRVEVSPPIAAHRLVDAALAVLDPTRALPVTIGAGAIVDGPRPSWLGGVAADAAPRPANNTVNYTPYGLVRVGEPELIVVDTAMANPVGRGPDGHDLPSGELSLTTATNGDVWWRVHTRTGRRVLVVAGRAGDPLDEAHRTALARLGTVFHPDSAPGFPEPAHASVIAQLAATGTVLYVPDLRPATRALIAGELRGIIERPPPVAGADPIEWELRSVAQRRAAMRCHGPAVAMAIAVGSPARAAIPTVSALLVTRRPANVARAIEELRAQTYPNIEIIVGLHGVELAADERKRLGQGPVPIEVVTIPADVSFGAALATASRAAGGSLIAKVDDDDRYGPEHIWDLVLGRAYSGATVVGKAAEFVHLGAYDTTVRRRMESELYTDVVAGGTILISRGDLDGVGGWRPLARAVDRALLDRVLDAGGLIYRTHGFGFVYSRHGHGHTWDPGPGYFLLNPLRHWSGQPPFAEFGTGPRGERWA